MDNLLFTDYRPDAINNVMVLKYVINDLGINASTSIPLTQFYTEIAKGEAALKELILNTLITALQAKLPSVVNVDTQTDATQTTEAAE